MRNEAFEALADGRLVAEAWQRLEEIPTWQDGRRVTENDLFGEELRYALPLLELMQPAYEAYGRGDALGWQAGQLESFHDQMVEIVKQGFERKGLSEQQRQFWDRFNHDVMTPLANGVLAGLADRPEIVRASLAMVDLALNHYVYEVRRGFEIEPNRERVELEEFLRGVIGQVDEALFADEKVRFEGDGGDFEVVVDAAAVGNMLGDILRNIRKYGGSKDRKYDVKVVFEQSHGVMEVKIRDRGEGFVNQMLEWVRLESGEEIRRFFMEGETTNGTGLGGAIIKEVCDRSGIEVDVSNWQENGESGGEYRLWFERAE